MLWTKHQLGTQTPPKFREVGGAKTDFQERPCQYWRMPIRAQQSLEQSMASQSALGRLQQDQCPFTNPKSSNLRGKNPKQPWARTLDLRRTPQTALWIQSTPGTVLFLTTWNKATSASWGLRLYTEELLHTEAFTERSFYRRKFRSQASDNMDRWKLSRVGQRQREEKD